MSQRQTNPFPYSDTNKRYHTFSYFTRTVFGGKCVRVPLDGGFSCPNRDGRCGTGGCVFCADGAYHRSTATVREQYASGVAAAARKWKAAGYIPYLGTGTNTYAPPARLASLYGECAVLPGAVMLAVGTRADCLDDGVIDVLRRTSERIPLLVELGMQTSREETLHAIGRGYGHGEFAEGYHRLRAAGGDIRICLHLMNGLPGESREDMLESVREAARLEPDMVKLHTVCVLRGTPLETAYSRGQYVSAAADFGETVALVCDELTLLPPHTVIGRITAEAPAEMLVAPAWARAKRAFENAVDRQLFESGRWQGCRMREIESAAGGDRRDMYK